MSKSKYESWIELVTSGGAKSFLEYHPDDTELADRMNAFLPGSGVITAEQIGRDRKRYHERPQRGEVLDEEEASPTKYVIRNKATQLTIQEALAEILDNIFDNFERNNPEKLTVEIAAYPRTEAAPGELLTTENSGGIERKRVVPLIQLGFSERSARGIGAWGEGFKMAVFALGEEVEVFSTYPGEEPIAIHFPKGWLDPGHSLWKKWKVNTYKVKENAPKEGTTITRINYLQDRVLESLGLNGRDSGKSSLVICDELADYFGEVYAEKYHSLAARGYDEISISLSIGSVTREVKFKDPVRDRLRKNLAFMPWLRPIHWTASWETEIEDPSQEYGSRLARLSVEIYAGLAATFNYSKMYPTQQPGVEMWGNGRLFSLKGLITDASAGWEYKFGGGGGTNPASNASSRRLTIVVLFTAEDSRDIPWAAPVKNDYNRRSEFYAEIQETFAKVISTP